MSKEIVYMDKEREHYDYDKLVYIVKQLEDFRRCALRDFKILRKRCRDLEEKLNWISETETE